MSNLDNSYFNSYGDISIHELMLNDKIRTDAYEHFISNNEQLFTNKIILDVGSGTGILSLFSARAGAKMVYAVEANECISKISLQIVKKNGYSEKIKVINDRVENINIEKVDIIISEWMGFYLLHESMMDSVIYARDRFLKFDGIMIPALAHIYVCPTSIDSFYKSNLQNWKSFHGFDFGSFGENLSCINSGIKIMSIKETDLLDDPKIIASFDLKYVQTSDLNRIISSFQFKANKYSVLRGYAFWFNINFIDNSAEIFFPIINYNKIDTTKDIEQKIKDNLNPTNNLLNVSNHKVIQEDILKNFEESNDAFNLEKDCLDTSPRSPDTHWHQTIVILPDSYFVSENQTMACNIEIIREMHWLKINKNSIDGSDNENSNDKNINKMNQIYEEKSKSTDLEISRRYRIILQIQEHEDENDLDEDMIDDGYDIGDSENGEEGDGYNIDIRTEIAKIME